MYVLVYSYNSRSSVSPSCPVPPKRGVVKNVNYRIYLVLQGASYIIVQGAAAMSPTKPRNSIRAGVLSLRKKDEKYPLCLDDWALRAYF